MCSSAWDRQTNLSDGQQEWTHTVRIVRKNEGTPVPAGPSCQFTKGFSLWRTSLHFYLFFFLSFFFYENEPRGSCPRPWLPCITLIVSSWPPIPDKHYCSVPRGTGRMSCQEKANPTSGFCAWTAEWGSSGIRVSVIQQRLVVAQVCVCGTKKK